MPPILKPSCSRCLIERGVAFKLASGWPVRVDVVPYDPDVSTEARIAYALIQYHRDERLT